MIEIIPHSDSLRESYHVPSVVDIDAYLYIYNEVFVEDWNQYIKKIKADSHFMKSKWIPVESQPANGVSLETVKAVVSELGKRMSLQKKMAKDQQRFYGSIQAERRAFCPLRGGFLIPRSMGVVADSM